MNLKHIRLLHEDADNFHLHDTKKGDKFKVAKKGLSKGTLSQIAQHFAKGGQVDDISQAPQKLSEESASSFVGPLSASQYLGETEPILSRPMALSPERLLSYYQELGPPGPRQAMAPIGAPVPPEPGPPAFVGPPSGSQYVGGMDPVLERPMAMSPERLLSYYQERLPPPSAQPARRLPSNFIENVAPPRPIQVYAKMMRPHFVTPPAAAQAPASPMLQVRGRDGKSVKASKKHLKPTTVAMMQGYADGGEVEPGGLPPGYESFLAASGADPSMAAGVQAPAPLLPGQVPAGYGPLLSGMSPEAMPQAAPSPMPGPMPSGPGQNMTPAAGFTPMPEPMPPAQAPAPQAQAAPPRAMAPKAAGGMGPQDKAIMDAAPAESKAVQAQADIASQAASASLGIQQRHEAERQALTQEWNQRWQHTQSRADALTQEIANSKIDPQHFWNSRTTGQRIAGTIGLILGGIGQAFGGGPNAALHLIQGAIDRDLEAQKAELGKKQGLLSHYVQQGHAIKEAQQLARADMADGLAGQLQMAATKFAGPQAQAQVPALQAVLKKKALEERQEVFGKGLTNSLKALQLRYAQMALNQAGAGQPPMVAPGYTQGNVAVKPEEASQFRDALAAKADISSAATELAGLIQKYGTEALPTGVKRKMESLRADMLLKIKDMNKLGAISETDMALMTGLVPEVATWTPEALNQALPALEQLQANIERKLSAQAYSRDFRRVGGPTPQGLVTEQR